MNNAKNTLLIVLSSAFLGVFAPSAQADDLIEGAKLCTRFLPRFEREYAIPVHLLSAISSTESGRWHEGLKLSIPWPWTINAEGKGYYLKSKQEALQLARKLQAQGVKSMDVGCMQVNLLHHPNAFKSLEEAFEPQNNIAYAAGFLRALYQEMGNWKQAASAYHSRTPSHGTAYVGHVYNRWYAIIDKLRMARTVVANADATSKLPSAVQIANAKPAPAAPLQTNNSRMHLGEQDGRKLAKQEPVRSKIIKVKEQKPQRENGIIVIRPDVPPALAASAAPVIPASSKKQEVNVADARHAAALSPSSSAPSQQPAQRGPRFIFTD